jgi:hypothetical protein
MNVEELFESPIYYKDGDIDMRLILLGKPVNAVCLEWCLNGEWHEVSSMRAVAFQSVLNRIFEIPQKEIEEQ